MSYSTVPTTQIIPSATNPRKHFDAHALEELTESVRKHGVLQPILLRKIAGDRDWRVGKAVTLPGEKSGYSITRGQVPDAVMFHAIDLGKAEAHKRCSALNSADYELVVGERRWRAACAAQLTEVPAVVRELTDQECVEIQVIENLQRADLHPLEEAEGYERLTRDYHYTVDDLAVKVGKSKAHVYGRIKLLALIPAARKAFEKGDLTPSVALLVARVPTALQQEVLDAHCVDYDGDPTPFREVKRAIEHHYMLRLSEAPWSPKDAELLPAAGACSACPKRTGNQPDLFSDVSHKDTCTDPQCFKAKREAWNVRTLDQAQQKGQTVKKTEEVFDQYGNIKKGYVKLNDRCEPLGWESKKTWAQALAKAEVEPVVTTTKDGDVVSVLPASEAVAALKESGVKLKVDAGKNRYDAATKRRAKRKALNTQIAMAAAPRLIEACTKLGRTDDQLWALLAKAVYEVTDIGLHEFVAKRRGLATKVTEARPALERWFSGLHGAVEYAGMLVELLLAARWGSSWEHTFEKHFILACELANIDLVKIETEIKALEGVKAGGKSRTVPPPEAPKSGTKDSQTVRRQVTVESGPSLAAAAKARWAKSKGKRCDDPDAALEPKD